MTGEDMHNLAKELFPINRSLMGAGVRETLAILQKHIPLEIHEVPSGTQVYDWTVGKEWVIRDAYILDPDGNKIVDFKNNNLHVVGYSRPIKAFLTFKELQPYLHSIPELPDAIPYETSYYKEDWGFCITHNYRNIIEQRDFKGRLFYIMIDSELIDGSLTYGELVIKGAEEKEILVSTYLCHPSMANDNLSGVVVAVALAKYVMEKPRRYTYRFVFGPETIGPLVYLSKHLSHLRENMIAGFNLTCMGDERLYSYLKTRCGNTLADRVAKTVLSFGCPGFKEWDFRTRASDERQYQSPHVDLPLVSLMRSKYATYPEYHTSKDDLELVTAQGLQGSYDVAVACFDLLENNRVYTTTTIGEPQLGKRGLYPTGERSLYTTESKTIVDILAYADGKTDVVEMCNRIGVAPWYMYTDINRLVKEGLLQLGFWEGK